MRGVACGAMAPFAVVASDYLNESGNGFTDHLADETASESDDTTPYPTEFVLEGSFQLGPHRGLIGLASFPSRIVCRHVGVKGIHPGLLPFGRW